MFRANLISISGSLVCILLLGTAYIASLSVENLLLSQPKIDVPIESLPAEMGEWTAGDSFPLDARAQMVLKLDRYIKRTYHRAENEMIFLYIGYWKKQSGDNQAGKHSPVLCLPANGWQISKPAKTTWQLKDTENISTSTLNANFQNHSTYITYWFFQGTDIFTNETEALICTNLGLLLGKRADGGIVEITVPLDKTKDRDSALEEAKQLTESFLSDFIPNFTELLEVSPL